VVKGPDRRLQGIITRPLQSRSSRRQEDNVYGKLRSDTYWRIAGFSPSTRGGHGLLHRPVSEGSLAQPAGELQVPSSRSRAWSDAGLSTQSQSHVVLSTTRSCRLSLAAPTVPSRRFRSQPRRMRPSWTERRSSSRGKHKTRLPAPTVADRQ
jgi:hypothetical protein